MSKKLKGVLFMCQHVNILFAIVYVYFHKVYPVAHGNHTIDKVNCHSINGGHIKLFLLIPYSFYFVGTDTRWERSENFQLLLYYISLYCWSFFGRIHLILMDFFPCNNVWWRSLLLFTGSLCCFCLNMFTNTFCMFMYCLYILPISVYWSFVVVYVSK